MSRVLVVDDERKMRRILQILLEQMGCESLAADSGEEALQLCAAEAVDLILTDLKMPGIDGIELIRRVRALDVEVPVIVFTAFGTVETAVEAMKQGAADYILKPFDIQAVELVIRRALDTRRDRKELRFLKEQVQTSDFADIIGSSPQIQRVLDLVRQVAPAKTSVLITGETGTGKELIARAIHRLSPRQERLFVALNCAAIPAELLENELFGHMRGAFTGAEATRAGKFETADGGTLFLDEIGDMAHALQAKLLRVLQEGAVWRIGASKPIAVDVRVVSSTNVDLTAAMQQGKFREDLFYRLNVFNLHLPPLRERRDDIWPLATFFARHFCEEIGQPGMMLAAAARPLLEGHHWPGNIRELRNVMERAAVLAQPPEISTDLIRDVIPEVHAVAEEVPESLALEPAVDALEKKLILKALGVTNDNKVEAARLLGVAERTLWYKLKRHGL